MLLLTFLNQRVATSDSSVAHDTHLGLGFLGPGSGDGTRPLAAAAFNAAADSGGAAAAPGPTATPANWLAARAADAAISPAAPPAPAAPEPTGVPAGLVPAPSPMEPGLAPGPPSLRLPSLPAAALPTPKLLARVPRRCRGGFNPVPRPCGPPAPAVDPAAPLSSRGLLNGIKPKPDAAPPTAAVPPSPMLPPSRCAASAPPCSWPEEEGSRAWRLAGGSGAVTASTPSRCKV